MNRTYPRIVAAAIALTAVVAHAEDPGKLDLEAAEMVASLIGAPVFAKDGMEVGRVADIAFGSNLRPKRLLITTGTLLGLGVRNLSIPKNTFMVLDGSVVLHVPAEAVSELGEPRNKKIP
jgi:sporulation protein YlmC with PRC-barrel domain